MSERRSLVAVAMATYHRSANLIPLVPTILDHFAQVDRSLPERYEFRLIIVDNDPDGSARASATLTGDPRVHYVVEPAPGVSSVRNRALAEAHDCDHLVFIDDDETPHDGWLLNLLSTQRAFEAHVVSGPVRSVFEGPIDPWVEASESHLRLHRAGLVTGTPITRAATNNLIIDMDLVRSLGLTFDERFGLTGGEDSFFTSQLHLAGANMVWCAEAIVDDLVPAARANRSYNLRRRYSMANSSVRVELMLLPPGWPRLRQRGISIAKGAAQIALGSAMTAGGVLGRSLKRRAYGERYVVGGVAMLAASCGLTTQPYKRTQG